MSTATKTKRETRVNLWNQMVAIMDSPEGDARADGTRRLSAEQAETYDRLEADLDTLEAEVDREEKHAALAKKFAHVDRTGVIPTGDPGEEVDEQQQAYDRAFESFVRDGLLNMTPEDRGLLSGNVARGDDGKKIQNAIGVGTGSAGGYLIPPGFRDIIIETMKWYGPMLDEAEVVTTETGANWQWPTNNDTGNMGAILAENTQISAQDVSFGTASLDAYMYTSLLVLVSLQLLQDKPDIDSWLGGKLGQRLGRILNNHFTVGTGTSQPDGIVTSSGTGVTGTGSFATTTGIAYANLVDLVESLDPAYGNAAGGTGNGSSLKFMMHQSMRKTIRKLLDGQNRPLWEPTVQAGAPDLLLGYPTRINNDMATLATSSKSLLFGDIKQAYVVRIVREMQLMQLRERYADYLQVGFFAFERADGTLQDANAVKLFVTTGTA